MGVAAQQTVIQDDSETIVQPDDVLRALLQSSTVGDSAAVAMVVTCRSQGPTLVTHLRGLIGRVAAAVKAGARTTRKSPMKW